MQTWTWDNIELNTLAWNVMSVPEGIGTPSKRGSNVKMPLTHGSRYSPKRYDERIVMLPMFVLPNTTAGVYGGIAQLDLNIDYLSGLFGRSGQRILKRTLTDGTERTATAEILQSIAFNRATPSCVKFAVEFLLADPFFYGVTPVSETTAISGTSVTWAHTNPGTAPLIKPTIALTGPMVSPKILNNTTGTWVQYNGSLLAGESLEINCADFSCLLDGVTVLTGLRHGGDINWFPLEPGDNSLTLTTSGTASGSSATISYYPAYF